MKIGILREEKIPLDKRVPLSPDQCVQLMEKYPNIEIHVMSSKHRCFNDYEYAKLGISIVEDLSKCDILFGIKEVPVNNLIPNKTYFYFSHTIKKQPYNKNLLKRMIDFNIKMVDYEVLKSSNGSRLIGFGRYAGIVGAYNALRAFGIKKNIFNLTPAYLCKDKKEMEGNLKYLNLSNQKIVLTGFGRVGMGCTEILNYAKIKEVSKEEFLYSKFDYPVFTHIDIQDYNIRIDGSDFEKNDFYNQPELFTSSFMKFAQIADIFIAGHYYAQNSPIILAENNLKHTDFNIDVIADISCDINGPIASTIRSSTINDPIYGYNLDTSKEDDFMKKNTIAVMAVDNLPCELPRDSSENFGKDLLEKIFPLLVNSSSSIIKKATICDKGELTNDFKYLYDFVYSD